MAQTALITGFPGFIGRRLAAKLLADDPKLALVALVEPRMVDAARTAADELDPKRLEVVAGDIGQRDLGLGERYEPLRSEVRRVFHLAAIYDLAVPLQVAQRVNVDGTGNVLDFCLGAKRLERLIYVSTAYVAGWRTGTVYEHELSLGQRFKNHYESTKFQAEVWVRAAIDRVPTTVLRPAIVVGDSQHGGDAEVRRPLLHPEDDLGRRARRQAGAELRPLERSLQRRPGRLRGRRDGRRRLRSRGGRRDPAPGRPRAAQRPAS